METKDAVPALAALAQENRLQIFRVLVEAGPEGVAAGQIAERLEIPSQPCRSTWRSFAMPA